MPKIKYQDSNFRPATLALIETANRIIAEYRAQRFDLTLRQLYYQFVSRGTIPNTQKSYKNLGAVVNDARLAGMIRLRQHCGPHAGRGTVYPTGARQTQTRTRATRPTSGPHKKNGNLLYI